MAQHETSQKRSRQHSGGGILALILILLIAGTIGYIYYAAVKAPLELDDHQKLASSAPMDAADRFTFSQDGTVQVKLDKRDIWHMIVSFAGPDFLDLVNDEISSYGLTVTGCAIHMDEDGLRLELELYFKDTRLVAKAPCELQVTGERFKLVPTGVYLGVIPLPVSGLLSSIPLEYELTLPVISRVDQISFETDTIVLTGIMEDLSLLAPPVEKLQSFLVFTENPPALAEQLLTQAGRETLTADLETGSVAVEDLYRELFTLAVSADADAYLITRLGLTQQFFPGIDFDAVAADRAAMEADISGVSIQLEQFFTKAVNDYNEKRFVLSNGQFLKNWVPFQAAQYGGEAYASLFQILDPESVFLVLVDAEDGHIRKTSSFERMVDKNQKFTQEVNYTKTYILGCVFRGIDGRPYLMYESETHENNTYYRVIKLVSLTEEETAALQVPGVFGVYIGG